MSDSFAGIRLVDVPGFIVAQFLGAIAATLIFRWLVPITTEDAETVIISHEERKNEKL